MTHSGLRAACVLLACWSWIGAAAAELLDDRHIRLHSARDIRAARQRLIQHVWGEGGIPKRRLPSSVSRGVPSPVQKLEHLARVDELRYELHPTLTSVAYHFIPKSPNRSLVIVHHGHACTLDDDPSPEEKGYGLQRTLRALLAEGFGVLGVFMPHMRPGDCTGGHDAMFQIPTPGNPMRFFVEPVIHGLNYLSTRSREDQFPRYRHFHMAGLSGGGWSTTICAALDPRILTSFSVAGTMPLYLRSGGSVGDREQFDPAFYSLAGYPELYVLSGSGRKRVQYQIHVRGDDCCFGERQHDLKKSGAAYEESLRAYAARVQTTLAKTGGGRFELVVDEVAPSHMISHHAIRTWLIPELRRSRE